MCCDPLRTDPQRTDVTLLQVHKAALERARPGQGRDERLIENG